MATLSSPGTHLASNCKRINLIVCEEEGNLYYTLNFKHNGIKFPVDFWMSQTYTWEGVLDSIIYYHEKKAGFKLEVDESRKTNFKVIDTMEGGKMLKNEFEFFNWVLTHPNNEFELILLTSGGKSKKSRKSRKSRKSKKSRKHRKNRKD
jgi:hypothetical protein